MRGISKWRVWNATGYGLAFIGLVLPPEQWWGLLSQLLPALLTTLGFAIVAFGYSLAFDGSLARGDCPYCLSTVLVGLGAVGLGLWGALAGPPLLLTLAKFLPCALSFPLSVLVYRRYHRRVLRARARGDRSHSLDMWDLNC